MSYQVNRFNVTRFGTFIKSPGGVRGGRTALTSCTDGYRESSLYAASTPFVAQLKITIAGITFCPSCIPANVSFTDYTVNPNGFSTTQVGDIDFTTRVCSFQRAYTSISPYPIISSYNAFTSCTAFTGSGNGTQLTINALYNWPNSTWSVTANIGLSGGGGNAFYIFIGRAVSNRIWKVATATNELACNRATYNFPVYGLPFLNATGIATGGTATIEMFDNGTPLDPGGGPP